MSVAETWGQLTGSKGPIQAGLERLGMLWYLLPPFNPDESEKFGNRDMIYDALPIFFALMIFEYLYGKFVLKRTLYTLGDTLGSIGSSIAMNWFSHLVKICSFPVYIYVYKNLALTRAFPGTMAWISEAMTSQVQTFFLWIVVGLLVDFMYYWYHRVSHEFQFLWNAHRVHHSGEHYNLSTALRQGGYQPLFSFFLSSLPLAFLGVPPKMHSLHYAMNTIAQFWFHTEIIRKMPFGIEYLFNTPAHHRRHHIYPGNCNYAGVLIIWDRLFGTFEQEPDRKGVEGVPFDPNYGTAQQMSTFNGVEMNLIGIRKLFDIVLVKHRGLLVRRWNTSKHGSGNYTGDKFPELRRSKYKGVEGFRTGAALWCRYATTLALLLVSLGLQFFCKGSGFFQTLACAFAGWGLIYMGGMCVDGPGKKSP